MARRSPWAKQPRRERNAIRAVHGILPAELKPAQNLLLMRDSPEKVSLQDKLNFLLKNKKDVASLIKTPAGISHGEKLRQIQSSLLSRADEANVNALTQMVLERNSPKFAMELKNSIQNSMKDFLKARKIPFDEKVSNRVTGIMLTLFPNSIFRNGKFNVRLMEKIYLQDMKVQRSVDQRNSEKNNKIIRAVFKGAHLSGAQLRSIRSWLDVNVPALETKIAQRIVDERVPGGIRGERGKEIFVEEFIRAMGRLSNISKADLPKPARQTQAPAPVQTSPSVIKAKPGSREERKRLYDLQKARGAGKSIESSAAVSKPIVPKPLTIAEKAIKDFGNMGVTKPLIGLVKEGILGEKQMTALMTEPLVKRAMGKALGAEFEKSFGKEKIPLLFNLIFYIGRKGEKVIHTNKRFANDHPQELLKFLESNKVIRRVPAPEPRYELVMIK